MLTKIHFSPMNTYHLLGHQQTTEEDLRKSQAISQLTLCTYLFFHITQCFITDSILWTQVMFRDSLDVEICSIALLSCCPYPVLCCGLSFCSHQYLVTKNLWFLSLVPYNPPWYSDTGNAVWRVYFFPPLILHYDTLKQDEELPFLLYLTEYIVLYL